MDWTVVEDEELDGVDYKKARDHFDAWVKEELADGDERIENSNSAADWKGAEARGHPWSYESKLEYRLNREPRHAFLVFVDEEAVSASSFSFSTHSYLRVLGL